jgi:hypothetical protein
LQWTWVQIQHSGISGVEDDAELNTVQKKYEKKAEKIVHVKLFSGVNYHVSL